MAGRIFVSYRREDSAYATGWLTDRLTEHYDGGEVFTDVDSIEIGDDFVGRITEAVASCDVLLAVIGQKWLTAIDKAGHRRLDDPNDYVRIEIEAALRRDVLVIPILVDQANMPDVSDLPGRPEVPGGHPEPQSLATLPRREALSLTPNQFDWALDRLLNKLDKALLGPGGTKVKINRGVTRPRKQAKQTLPNLSRWIAIGLLAVAIGMLLLRDQLGGPFRVGEGGDASSVLNRTHTDVRFMRPFSTSHKLADDFRVVQRLRGTCRDGDVSSDPQALRCSDKSGVHWDPCWRRFYDRVVACPKSPWDAQVWLFHQTNPVRYNRNPFRASRPWAMKVVDPLSRQIYGCLSVPGTADVFAGMRANWSCHAPSGTGDGVGGAGQALGELRRRRGDIWTVRFTPPGSAEVRTASVLTVWK